MNDLKSIYKVRERERERERERIINRIVIYFQTLHDAHIHTHIMKASYILFIVVLFIQN